MKVFAPALPGLNAPLAVAFMRKLSDAPYRLVAGGTMRSFTGRTLPQLTDWMRAHQTARRAVFVMPPMIEGGHWYVVARLPLTASPADCSPPPQFIIVADDFTLLWRLAEPVSEARAKALARNLVAEAGGRDAVGQPVPLPGTMLMKEVRLRMVQRFPVHLLPPLAAPAYHVVEGRLRSADAKDDGHKADDDFTLADELDLPTLQWCWPDVIPSGELSLIMGEPKIGKSQIAVDLVARVTCGSAWPNGAKPSKPGGAILIECEDPLSVTKSRLAAAGADMKRLILSNVPRNLSQAEGIAVLDRQIAKLGGIHALVLSPIRMFFGETEAHRQVDMRQRLEPLLNWASKNSVAIIGIAHKDAGRGGRSAEDLAGPKALAQRARAILTAMIDPADKHAKPNPKAARRILTTAGSNLGSDHLELPYRIESVKTGGTESSRVIWGGD